MRLTGYPLLLLLFLICPLRYGYAEGNPASGNGEEKVETRIKAYGELAAKDPVQAVQQASELLKKLTKNEDKKNRAEVLKIIGAANYNLQNERLALEYYEQALILYRELDDDIGVGSMLNNIGLLRESQGDYRGALKRYVEAAKIFEDKKKEKYLALSLTNIGNIYYTLGRYDKSLEYHTNALKINENIKDSTGLSMSYNNIGNVYLNLQDYPIALDFYNKALAINKTRNNLYSLATSYNNIGLAYQGMGVIDKTVEHNRLALELSRKTNDQIGMIHSLLNSGNIYLDKGNLDQALIYYKEALRISQTSKREFIHANVLQSLANLYVKRNNPDEAITLFNEALVFAKSSESLLLLNDIYSGLAEAWQQKGEYKKAYEFMSASKSIADSTYNLENTDRLNLLRVSFESEQTERDNQLLRQQKIYDEQNIKRQTLIRNLLITIITIVIVSSFFVFSLYQSKKKKNILLLEQNEKINRQKEELNLLYREQYKLNETKNKFFAIVAHDLKSPFQSIMGFSELLSSEYEYLDEMQRREAAYNIFKVSTDTLRLIENLLEWGRSQNKGTQAVFKTFNIKELIDNTLPVFKPQLELKNISLNFDLPPMLKAWADPDMIMTVVRNLMSNAIKFTPVGGNITISAFMVNDKVKLSIKDSGDGIPPEVKAKLFTLDPKVQRAGTMGERGTGLGLTLCHEFMVLNLGSIDVESQTGKGSTFTVSMLSKYREE